MKGRPVLVWFLSKMKTNLKAQIMLEVKRYPEAVSSWRRHTEHDEQLKIELPRRLHNHKDLPKLVAG